jgi:hypothetical protein
MGKYAKKMKCACLREVEAIHVSIDGEITKENEKYMYIYIYIFEYYYSATEILFEYYSAIEKEEILLLVTR